MTAAVSSSVSLSAAFSRFVAATASSALLNATVTSAAAASSRGRSVRSLRPISFYGLSAAEGARG
jgi:hypothetical protein